MTGPEDARDGDPGGTPAPELPAKAEAAAAYLVVLRHIVVAQDIAQTVADFDPRARVIVAASPPEAVRALDGTAGVALAFVGQGPRAFEGSALAAALARHGARVVLMGSEAEGEGEAAGFAVLARPFSMGAVMAHLGARPEP